MNKPFEDKPLSPAEKLRVAVAVLNDGWDQHKVAALLGVMPERVAEAIASIRPALDSPANDPIGQRILGLEAVARAVGGRSGDDG